MLRNDFCSCCRDLCYIFIRVCIPDSPRGPGHSMKKYLFTLFTILVCVSVSADNGKANPEQWYRKSYGPIWADKPTERLDEILDYYADEVVVHSSDGKITRQNNFKWLSGLMTEWQEDGWLSSELAGLRTDRINPSTVSFKASWLDHYEGAEDQISCGWYLAALHGVQWKFTVYTEIDCASHGL